MTPQIRPWLVITYMVSHRIDELPELRRLLACVTGQLNARLFTGGTTRNSSTCHPSTASPNTRLDGLSSPHVLLCKLHTLLHAFVTQHGHIP
jgi:hypothetical protein